MKGFFFFSFCHLTPKLRSNDSISITRETLRREGEEESGGNSPNISLGSLSQVLVWFSISSPQTQSSSKRQMIEWNLWRVSHQSDLFTRNYQVFYVMLKLATKIIMRISWRYLDEVQLWVRRFPPTLVN